MTAAKHSKEGKTVTLALPQRLTAVRENVPVMTLAGIAFGGSYGHIASLCGHYGAHGWLQYAVAGTVDLLCVIGAEERQRDKRIKRSRQSWISWPACVLMIGITLTLFANVATAQKSPYGYFVAILSPGALLLAVSVLERRASWQAKVTDSAEISSLRDELDSVLAVLEGERASREAAEAALEGEGHARQSAEAERDTARLEAAQAAEREAALAAELADTKAATQADTGPRYKGDTKSSGSAGGQGSGGTGRRKNATRKTGVPADIDIQTEALRILASDPGISGSELGRRLGVQESYGRRLRNRLSAPAPGGGR